MTDQPLKRACAWCNRRTDEHGAYTGEPQPKVTTDEWTHGICGPCAEREYAVIRAYHAAGKQEGEAA
jgi:hypothetical protein